MTRISLHIVLLSILVTACEINQKEVQPEDGFLKIYNHPDQLLAFFPESVLQLPGGDYIFISAVKDENSDIEYPYTHVVRTGADGVVKWTQNYDWLAPASKLFLQNGLVGFIAMNEQFIAHAVLIDPSGGEVTDQHDLEMTMPLSAYKDADGNLIVLGYDFVSRSSWISKFNSSYTLQRSNKLPINDDLEHLIHKHLNKTGEDFPFYIGEYSNSAGTGYYVSCFYNYTLRTVFMDISSLNAEGDIYSFQTDEAISSALFKSGSLFGLTGFYEGNNYIVPDAEINVSTSQNIKNIPGEPLYELTHRARVVNCELSTEQGDFALFVSQTNTNALVVYQYDMGSDSLVNTHYQNFDERVEVSDVITTGDNGIAILAGVFILGKYQRPVMVKMPEKPFLPEE
jgi:hypothetical protein